jgi:hypothetical protein
MFRVPHFGHGTQNRSGRRSCRSSGMMLPQIRHVTAEAGSLLCLSVYLAIELLRTRESLRLVPGDSGLSCGLLPVAS